MLGTITAAPSLDVVFTTQNLPLSGPASIEGSTL
jgi:hypothetical protein